MQHELFPDLYSIPLVKDSSALLAMNPCIEVYGTGPSGKRCKDCALLTVFNYGRKRYYKCRLRRVSHSPATDHRVRWAACGRFIEREGAIDRANDYMR